MKKVIHLLAFYTLVVLGLSAEIKAQNGQFDLRFTTKSVDCITKVATIAVQVKATDAAHTFNMGDANYRFDFDPRQMRNPRIVSQENFSNLLPANNANYSPQNLNGSSTGTTIGTVSLNTFYSGSLNSAQRVGTEWLTISCIAFDIQSSAPCFSLDWHSNTRFPITGMSEVELLPNGEYNLHVVSASGFFGNIQSCLNTFCPTQPLVSIRKDLAIYQTNNVRLGGRIDYDIWVKNNQNIPLTNLVIVDSIPENLRLHPARSLAWSLSADGSVATQTLPFLAAGDSVAVPISMILVAGRSHQEVINYAFLRQANGNNGNIITTSNRPNDTACINILPFDPMGFVYDEGTGRLVTGGRIELVTAPVNGSIYFVTDSVTGLPLNGQNGQYQFFTNGVEGLYSIRYVSNRTLSTICRPRGVLSPANNDGDTNDSNGDGVRDRDNRIDGILTLGANADGNGQLISAACAENPYYFSFNLVEGAPFIYNNNIPLQTLNTNACSNDRVPPVITYTHPLLRGHASGDTLSFSCDAPVVFDETAVTATDNSGFVRSLEFKDIAQRTGNCQRDGFKILMECHWIATDSCGNVSRMVIFIKITDNQLPVFTALAPQNATVNLDSGQVLPPVALLSATDNCGNATVAYTETRINATSGCNYTILRTWTATDACGNSAQTSQSILVTQTVQAKAVVSAETCARNNGSIYMLPTTLTYRWSDGFQGSNRTQLKAGAYTVTASNSTGCAKVFTLNVADSCLCSSFIAQKSVVQTATTCAGLTRVCIKAQRANVASYYINDTLFYGGSFACDQGFIGFDLPKGNHRIVLVNSDGCRDTALVKIVCLQTETRVVNLRVGEGDTSCLDFKELLGSKFKITKINASNSLNANFSLMPGTSCVETWGLAEGQERVTYIVSDEFGTTDTTHFIANVESRARKVNPNPDGSTVVFYKGFSPNNDGLNDFFVIEGIENFENSTLNIYNRWGSEVLFEKNYKNNWNGKWLGNDLPDGTYFYIFKDGVSKTYSGYVQLQR
jgi:gliding motility-associated-like protein/uncharacterized repeat protein (TIGR01451 family)